MKKNNFYENHMFPEIKERLMKEFDLVSKIREIIQNKVVGDFPNINVVRQLERIYTENIGEIIGRVRPVLDFLIYQEVISIVETIEKKQGKIIETIMGENNKVLKDLVIKTYYDLHIPEQLQ